MTNYNNNIEELLALRSNIKFSFEFFPPSDEKMNIRLWDAISKLKILNPQFVSVTYGAGGSTRKRTHDTISRIINETNLKPASHLTCIGSSKNEIDQILRNYWQIGVRHIVALRGDIPINEEDNNSYDNSYKYASELVTAIKNLRNDNINYEISVAGYPEKHPEAKSLDHDIGYLKEKVDAGADRIITQFFFNCDNFLRFQEKCYAKNINVPIVPGILPVTNFTQVAKFAKTCQTNIPNWMRDIFSNLENKTESKNLIAAMIAIEQCRILMKNNIKDFHFYTLNRSELTLALCNIINSS